MEEVALLRIILREKELRRRRWWAQDIKTIDTEFTKLLESVIDAIKVQNHIAALAGLYILKNELKCGEQ